jgi:hypothetical protein
MKQIAKVISIDGKHAVAEQAGSGWLIGAARFDDVRNAQALALSMNADLYEVCPACSGPRVPYMAAQAGDIVSRCASCGARFGTVASWLDYVKLSPMSPGDSVRYFDFTRQFSGERFHGWTDAAGRVTQIG